MADGLAFGVGLVGAEIARLSNEQAQRYPLIYRWDRQGCKGQRCRVLARGAKGSVLLEFASSQRMVTSGMALKRAEPR
jgi:hypothetical protein